MSTELVIVEGREYEVSQPSNEDWEWLETAMRAEPIAAAKEAGLTGEDLIAIVKDAGKRSIWSSEGMEWVQTRNGLSRLTYRCLKPKHPDIKLSECARWIFPNKQDDLIRAVINQGIVKSLGGGADTAKKNDPQASEMNPPTGSTSAAT